MEHMPTISKNNILSMLIITCRVRKHRKGNGHDGLGLASEPGFIHLGQMQERVELIAGKTLETGI